MLTKLLNVKTAITVGIFLLLSFLIGTTTYLYKENKKLNTKVSDQSIELKAKGQGTVAFVDKKGNLHSQSIQYIENTEHLREARDSASKAFLKMVSDYEVKIKDLSQAAQVSTTATYTSVKVKYVPTTRDTTYDLSSLPFIINKINIKQDSLSNDLQIFNKQSILWHTKRETIDPPKKFFLFRWFQKKHDVTYVDIINDNPFIKTTGQNFIITK